MSFDLPFFDEGDAISENLYFEADGGVIDDDDFVFLGGPVLLEVKVVSALAIEDFDLFMVFFFDLGEEGLLAGLVSVDSFLDDG